MCLLQEEFKGKDFEFPLATSIVLSGIYEDDLDNSEDVVYTGQGGNNLLGDKHQISDQVMQRGNLALKVCLEHILHIFFLFSMPFMYLSKLH